MLSGQTPPASTPVGDAKAGETATATFNSDFGFSYTYPSAWERMDTAPITPAAQLKAQENANSDMEKRGAECTQIGLMVRHGDPRSLILVLVLPYACVDSVLKQSDLAAAASGMAEGLKKSYDITEPRYSAYKLGTHEFWIERAKGSPKDHPEVTHTVEVTCGMLKSAMICWMGFLHDEDSLKAMEGGLTSLEGEPAVPLVPETVFKSAK